MSDVFQIFVHSFLIFTENQLTAPQEKASDLYPL